MSEEMYDEGYQHIMNVDNCDLVVKAMQERYKDKEPNMKCTLRYDYINNDVDELMDARKMGFKDQSFDCVIDKGTLDSILVMLYLFVLD